MATYRPKQNQCGSRQEEHHTEVFQIYVDTFRICGVQWWQKLENLEGTRMTNLSLRGYSLGLGKLSVLVQRLGLRYLTTK